MLKKARNRSKPADRKMTDAVERRAANRTGISYGKRQAGRGSEHFEVGHGKHVSHSSTKGGRFQTKEQRIVAG